MISGAWFRSTSFLYIFALIASVFISYWVDASETVINPDAICYLFSAEEVGQGGISAAMHLCPQAIWPFYSILIFAFSKITQLSSMNAAFILNGMFSMLSVAAFIAIVKELGGSKRVMWLAVLVILLSHEFNILRQDIIRDHGFWAFYLSSIFLLLRFFRQTTWINALIWSASLLVATLFRIEGAIFLLLMPMAVWFDVRQGWQVRLRHFIMLNTPLLLLGCVLTLRLLLHPQEISLLGRVPEIWHQLHHGIEMMLGKYQATRVAVSTSVLSHVSMRDASLVVSLLLVAWYLISVIGNLSWVYGFLVVYAWVTKAARYSRGAFIVVLGYLLVNVAVTFTFFAETHFLAKRYLIALSLVLMFWVPFALDRMLQSRGRKERILLWIVSLLMAVSAIGGLFHFGHSKDYVREAGDWLSNNVPVSAELYSNDYQIMYYSHHFGSSIFKKLREYNDVSVISEGRWKKYDYLALLRSVDKDDKTALIMQEIHLTPQQVFVSHSGNHVYIYKIAHREKIN